MKNALLEIGIEHMPARFMQPTFKQMQETAAKLLAEKRLGCKSIKAFGTFRRLALVLEEVQDKSSDMQSEVMGPPARLLKGADGKYTPQSEGFARKNGISPENIEVVKTEKGEFLCARKTVKGEPALKILSEVFPAVVKSLQFPKNMVWEPSLFRFARPLRSLMGLYGNKVVPFEIAGVKSAKKSPPFAVWQTKPITIADADSYVKTLEKNCILVLPETRREALVALVGKSASQMDFVADMDESLLEETVYLTEHPVPVVGNFSHQFLKLPQEFLTTVQKKQLKFFPVLDKNGKIQPHFIAVRDGKSDNQDEVRKGFESVVTARLADAVFFFEKDLTHTLEEMRTRLEGVMFHERLGSIHRKSLRVEKLAGWICQALRQDSALDESAVVEAAGLAYADLTSEVVREFPELQGYMGGEYAGRSGKSSKCAHAIKEFYFPLTAKSAVPMTMEGAIASLAGKIDTLVSDFAVGMIPTGSEDPHALRRQAAGAVRILLEKNMPLSAAELCCKAAELVAADISGEFDREATVKAVDDFIWQRAETLFEEMGFRFDEVRAVRCVQFDGNGKISCPKSLPEILHRVSALREIRKHQDFESIAVAFKRVANILKKAEAAEKASAVEETLFAADGPESGLWKKLQEVGRKVEPRLACNAAATKADFESALLEMETLKPAVDAFFEKVMVMDQNPQIRRNRIALLDRLHRLLSTVADLSQLQ